MKKRKTYNKIGKAAVGTWMITSLLLISPGCDEFLDDVPDNRVSLDNLDKAAQLVTNAYSIASPAFTDWMTDDVGFLRGVNIRLSHQQIYDWEDVTTGPDEQDTPDFFWYETYAAIAHANEVLAVIDELLAESEEEIQRREAIRAEALLARAYAHFMLVNLFAKDYDASTAGADDGIPYVKDPETKFIQTYERISIRRVYDEIENDLLEGLENVNDNFYANSGKYHFTRNAALAFASRFYLFKRDFVRCLFYCNEFLGENPETFVRDMTSDEYQLAKSSITGYPQLFSSPDEPANVLLMRKISLVQRTDFAHGPTRTGYGDLFGLNPFPGATDERENPAFVKGENGLLPVRYQSLFQRSSLNSDVGTPYHIAISLRGEEVLFNRIECNIVNSRIGEAIADLDIFVRRRYSGPNVQLTEEILRDIYGVTDDPSVATSLILGDFYLTERRKEFVMQGMRWFDIKRFDISVEHNQLNGSISTLEENDLRKVLQIPRSAIDVGGLEPNPR